MRLQEKRDFACRMTKFSGCAKMMKKDLIFGMSMLKFIIVAV